MANNVNIINTALSLQGKLKYDYNGNNIANGYGDCSDFTEFVYAQNGVEIGSYSEAQYKKATKVNKAKALAGDLIFFTGDSGYIDSVSHVGIYLGNGQLIDLGADGCEIHSISENWYSNHFLSFGRIKEVEYTDFVYDDVLGEYISNGENIDFSDDENSGTENNSSGNTKAIIFSIMLAFCVILFIVFIAAGIGLHKGKEK